jgi:hypothetical protein
VDREASPRAARRGGVSGAASASLLLTGGAVPRAWRVAGGHGLVVDRVWYAAAWPNLGGTRDVLARSARRACCHAGVGGRDRGQCSSRRHGLSRIVELYVDLRGPAVGSTWLSTYVDCPLPIHVGCGRGARPGHAHQDLGRSRDRRPGLRGIAGTGDERQTVAGSAQECRTVGRHAGGHRGDLWLVLHAQRARLRHALRYDLRHQDAALVGQGVRRSAAARSAFARLLHQLEPSHLRVAVLAGQHGRAPALLPRRHGR